MELTTSYLPALGYHWLTPFYDPLFYRFTHEDELRGRLVLKADILPGMRLLDLGCGTGTLTLLAKRSHQLCRVFGIDVDPQILHIAGEKVAKAGVEISLLQGMAYQLLFPNAWFDRVLTSLVFHQLSTQQKQQALGEVYRVLRPGGKFTILDIGAPRSNYTRLIFLVIRRTERSDDNIRGLLPGMCKKAGFVNINKRDSLETLFGSLILIRAEKQARPGS